MRCTRRDRVVEEGAAGSGAARAMPPRGSITAWASNRANTTSGTVARSSEAPRATTRSTAWPELERAPPDPEAGAEGVEGGEGVGAGRHQHLAGSTPTTVERPRRTAAAPAPGGRRRAAGRDEVGVAHRLTVPAGSPAIGAVPAPHATPSRRPPSVPWPDRELSPRRSPRPLRARRPRPRAVCPRDGRGGRPRQPLHRRPDRPDPARRADRRAGVGHRDELPDHRLRHPRRSCRTRPTSSAFGDARSRRRSRALRHDDGAARRR